MHPEQIFQRPLSLLLSSLTHAEVVATSTTAAPRSKNDVLSRMDDALVQGARGRPSQPLARGLIPICVLTDNIVPCLYASVAIQICQLERKLVLDI